MTADPQTRETLRKTIGDLTGYWPSYAQCDAIIASLSESGLLWDECRLDIERQAIQAEHDNLIVEALRAGYERAKQDAAALMDRWHISKGGYGEIAYRIRALTPAPGVDG